MTDLWRCPLQTWRYFLWWNPTPQRTPLSLSGRKEHKAAFGEWLRVKNCSIKQYEEHLLCTSINGTTTTHPWKLKNLWLSMQGWSNDDNIHLKLSLTSAIRAGDSVNWLYLTTRWWEAHNCQHKIVNYKLCIYELGACLIRAIPTQNEYWLLWVSCQTWTIPMTYLQYKAYRWSWLNHYLNSPSEGRTWCLWYKGIATESSELKNKVRMVYVFRAYHEIYQGDHRHRLFLYDLEHVRYCGPRKGVGIPKYIRPFQKTLGSLIRYVTK